MSYLSIDPGLDTGWAYFRDADTLLVCGLGDPCQLDTKSTPVRCVIIERPVIYENRLMKGGVKSANDIVTLAIQVGDYAGHFRRVVGAHVAMVTPGSWKGQVPKDIHNARVLGSLSAGNCTVLDECTRYVSASKRHNVIDAVALGLAAFKMRLWGK